MSLARRVPVLDAQMIPSMGQAWLDSPQYRGPHHGGSQCRVHGGKGIPGLTQDVDVAPGDAVEAGTDGALVTHVQLFDLQRPAQHRPRCRCQRPAPAHVPHGGDDWGHRRLSPARAPPGGWGVPPPRSPRKRRCLSCARRTASASPMPEEQPVISTVLGAMARPPPFSPAPRLYSSCPSPSPPKSGPLIPPG